MPIVQALLARVDLRKARGLTSPAILNRKLAHNTFWKEIN